MYQNRRRQPGMGLMLLFYQLFGVIGIENIPPVTLSSIGLQVAIFLRLFKLPWHDASQVCISAYKVWKRKEFMRLLYGALEHGDDMHLYYNMFSFALKGRSLERRYGSVKFLYLLSCFTVLTSAVLVALSSLASEKFGVDSRQCAIGFSGVIFALKVLTTYHDRNTLTQVMGIPLVLPAKYAVWIELVMIQLFVPNASFLGHLAGILVGMAYVTGPLKYILDSIYSAINGSFAFQHRPSFTQSSERTGYAESGRNARNFNQFVPPGMSEEEQLRRAMEESMQGSGASASSTVPPYPTGPGTSGPPPPGFVFGDNFHSPPPAGFTPDIEELRSRRTERFMS